MNWNIVCVCVCVCEEACCGNFWILLVHFAFAGNDKIMSNIIYHGQSRLEQTASFS